MIVGDSKVGKTCLFMSLMDQKIHQENIPQIYFNDKHKIFEFEGKITKFFVHDTGGDPMFDHWRHITYVDADFFLICFSIDNRESFHKVITKWNQDANHFVPYAKKILVGLKKDFRENKEYTQQLISYDSALDLQKQIKASLYFECSYLKENVKNILEESINIVMTKIEETKEQKKKCLAF